VRVSGSVENHGPIEATITQVLVSGYDSQGRVLWVEGALLENAVGPFRSAPFRVPLPSIAGRERLPLTIDGSVVAGEHSLPVSAASSDPYLSGAAIPVPAELAGTGYSSLRVTVRVFSAQQD